MAKTPDSSPLSASGDEGTAFEQINQGDSRGASLPVEDTRTRQRDRATDFNRGLFAVMSSYDWDKHRFCPHSECQELRRVGMDLLGIPQSAASAHMDSPQFDTVSKMMSEMKRQAAVTPKSPSEEYQVERVKALIALSKSRHADPQTQKQSIGDIFKSLRESQ